jgi:ABC-type glycerol-3-phosphate transport system substrate-binding protein
VKKALQQIYDFQYTYHAYDPVFINNWFADFPQNRIGMVLAGTWFAPAIKQNNPNVRFGVAPHPVVDPNDKNTYKNIQWAWGWCVNANKDPEQQKLAQEFMAFILGKKGETDQPAWWFKNLGYMQPSQAFLDSQAFKDTLQENPWMNQWITAFDTFQIESVPHSYDEAGATLVRAIDRIIYDKMSAEESATLWQAELERLGQ